MQDPFADLKSANTQGTRPQREDPFADLMPQRKESQSQERSEPSMQDRILRAQLNQRSPFMPGKGEEEKYGDVKLNLGEKIGNSLMDYAPYLIGGGGAVKGIGTALSKFPATAKGIASFAAKHPKWAKYLPMAAENMIGSAGYGAANAEEGSRGSEALVGAGIGLGASALGAGVVDPLLRYGAKKYAQSAIPEFTKKATDKIRELLPEESYGQKLYQNFLGKAKENKSAWSGLEKTAKDIDENVLRRTPDIREGALNTSPYRKYIEDYEQKVSAMEPALKAPYAQSSEIAKKSLELEPQSLSGAVGLRKNINKEMSDYIKTQGQGLTPENYQTKEFLKGLKENLKNETLDANKGRIGEESLNKFKNEWEGANKTHQEVNKFYKSPQKMTGVEKDNRSVKEAFKASLPKDMGGSGVPLDPSIVTKYLPSLAPSGAQGIQGLKQLSKLMGSKKEGVEAAKANIFRRQIENGAGTVDVAAQYSKLSPSQKKYLFGKSDEGRMLEAINKTRIAFDREPAKTLEKARDLHGLYGMGASGLAGMTAARLSGEDWEKSLGIGAITGMGGGMAWKGLAKSATVPRVEKAINFAKNGTTNTGKNLNTAYNLMRSRGDQ